MFRGRKQIENRVPQQFSPWNNYLETKNFLKSWKDPLAKMLFNLRIKLLDIKTTPELALHYIDDFKKQYNNLMAELTKKIGSYGLPYQAIISESHQALDMADGIYSLISWIIEQESSINELLSSKKYQTYTASGLLMLLSLWREPEALTVLEAQLQYVVTNFQTKARVSLVTKDKEILAAVSKILKNTKNLLAMLTELLQAIAAVRDDESKLIKNFRSQLLAITQLIVPYDYQTEDVSFATFFDNHPLLFDRTELNKNMGPEFLTLLRHTPQGQKQGQIREVTLSTLETLLPKEIIDLNLDYLSPRIIFDTPHQETPKENIIQKFFGNFNLAFLSGGAHKKTNLVTSTSHPEKSNETLPEERSYSASK